MSGRIFRWTIEQYHRDIKQMLGAGEFQGHTWRGFNHHMAVVVLTQTFVAANRLETGEANGGFDSFEEGGSPDSWSELQRSSG